MRVLPVLLTCALLAGCAAPEPQELEVGDCLLVAQVGERADDVPVVDCGEPHEAEVYAVVEPAALAALSAYDAEAVIAVAEEECVALFEGYVGEPYRTSALDVFYTYPLEDRWDLGEREVVCAVWAPAEQTGRPLLFEGSLAG